MLLRFHGPDPRIFEKWCERPIDPELERGNTFLLNEHMQQNRSPEAFQEDIFQYVINSRRAAVVNINYPQQRHSFTFDFSSIFTPEILDIEYTPQIFTLAISSTDRVLVRRSAIATLVLRDRNRVVEIRECCIGNLALHSDSIDELYLSECWIGHLELGENSVKNLWIEGGSIREMKCPLPHQGNPFAGFVQLGANVIFPTSTRQSRLLKGAQAYTNARTHLEKLENVPAANLMRSRELATERQTDRGVNWLVSWLYWLCSDYGLRPDRALLWAVAVYLTLAFVIFVFDGGSIGMDPARYHGWQVSLTAEGTQGAIWRSVILPLQSIVNPLGLFGVNRLVVTATGWAHALLAVQGLFTDALFVMVILAIRKRFRHR